MAGDSACGEESGVRRRRSGDHGDSDGVRRSGDDGVQAGTRALSSDSGLIVQTSATDVPRSPGRTSTDESHRVRFSVDVDRRDTLMKDKKRKSDDTTRELVGAKSDRPSSSGLSIDTRVATNMTAGPIVSSPVQLTSPARSPTSPKDTLSPKARGRGLSLRSSLFAKNIERRTQNDGSIIELVDTPSSSSASHEPRTPSKKPSHPSVTISPVIEKFPTSELSSGRASFSRKELQDASVALPNYQRWVANQAHRHLPIRKIKEIYKSARSFVLHIQDIPPSKDGRHVPLDLARKKAIIDERTGHPFINNYIKSSKYTPWNFLPRQLFAQFSKLANLYFLTVAILQMIPGLSTTGTYTTIIPLLFFVSISMGKEGLEDVRRHRLDKAENNREAKVLHAYRPVNTAEEQYGSSYAGADGAPRGLGPIHWASVKWQSLRVGDVVRLQRDDMVPADILLLDSRGENGIAYIETMALDGETNLKVKQPPAALIGKCTTPEAIASLEDAQAVVEDPNLDLYNFEGRLVIKAHRAPLTNNEIIYRGSVLRNTPEAIGMIIYSGEECKMRMNANRNPRIKAPSMQTIVNKIVIMMVIFVICLALFNTIAYQVWSATVEGHLWYVKAAHVAFGPIIVSFIIMFNTMIPLSLYVSMEIIKVAQMVLLNDIDMYDEASNTPFEARTSTINEELGQVSYVFSDKTGTLTENVMRFRKLSVAGTAWLHDADLTRTSEDTMLMHKKRRPKEKGKPQSLPPFRKSTSQNEGAAGRVSASYGAPLSRKSTWVSTAVPHLGQPELNTTDMIRYMQQRPHTAFARKARLMILSMAVCHTCLPEQKGDNEDDISYQASSPDELALVQAASELGFLAFHREVSTLTLKVFPNGIDAGPVIEQYEILDIIEFSSKRKRMSVVVRFPDGRICLLCKGADSALLRLLRLADLATGKVAEIDKRVNERRSMEAQQVLHRKSSTIDRQNSIGSYPRTSMTLVRPPTGRSSIGRLGSIRQNVDGWLHDRENDVAFPVDTSHYSPRPSAQLARKSLAESERQNSIPSLSDEEPLVEESLVLDEPAVIERCFQHINDFATEGLRTLLFGYRFLGDEEYRSWKKIYQDATTSLVNRKEMVEQAGEMIELQLELGGATAIEDKLQKGVPETIDRLRRANIKLWMLTGDKRETAINIGHSCRLIKDYSSITVLDYEAGGVEQSIAAAIIDINGGAVAHSVIIVDGQTLAMIQNDESLHTLFQDLAILADSVICCRASPSQKAGLVHAIRRRVNGSVTLAIGDGANDIAMIQEAHVGIGITGKEGLQAARSSDYSIAQFRFLTKLLLVHGRWNYIRVSKYTVCTFWKEAVFYLTQALFQHWNGYTGTSLYEQWSLSMFNTLFTSLPVIFLGIFEKDLAASTLIAVPELYNKGQRSLGFNFRVYLSWMFMAVAEAMIIFFAMRSLWGLTPFTFGKDLYSMGELTFTACVILINTKIQLLEQRNKSIVALICIIIEVGGWFLWNVILGEVYASNYEYDVRYGLLQRFGRNWLWWLILILTVTACILCELAVRALKNLFFPTDVEIFQALEKDPLVRRRFEEASAADLQAGWNHGSKKSSMELQREAEAQRMREGEVQKLLDRPRIMEEARAGQALVGIIDAPQDSTADKPRERRSERVRKLLSRRFGSIQREV